MKLHQLVAFLTLCIALPAMAQQAPQFALPIDCTLDQDCWIANYVDVDPSADSHQDFKCNAKTYEGHKGTDFALRNRAEMKKGVNVLAARDGTILRVRDGENDNLKTESEYKAIKEANKECGNGVIIDHGSGLLTYYCHLKNGSITVEPKQEVKKGETIAQVGQSGLAEFPHLHLTLIWEGGHIDPFTGMLKEDGCNQFKNNLWEDDLTYAPYAVFDGGFDSKVPDFKNIENGEKSSGYISSVSEIFAFWTSFYQIRKDDQITMTVKDPNGEIFVSRNITVEKNRARQHYYTGRKLNGKILKPGTYTGTTTIKRENEPAETHQYSVEVR